MAKKVIKLTEGQLKAAIHEAVKTYFSEVENKEKLFKHLSLLTQEGEKTVAYGNNVTDEYLYENIEEGLIMSYDINKSTAYLKNKFPNISKIRSLANNPYKRIAKTKKNQFVAIDLKDDYSNYKEIITQIHNLLGWFTSEIDIDIPAKGGFIKRVFYNFNGNFECNELNDEYSGENGIDKFLADHEIIHFTLIIEAIFGKRYVPQPGEKFYHGTDISRVDKILKQGLVPKSKGNFPERIYLGKDITEIRNMVGANAQELYLLEINVDGLELFQDEREETAYYTYDNIHPNRIVNIIKYD